jgi:2-C-methyl-D-erythritol 4-phosphate cytidylyltransferase
MEEAMKPTLLILAAGMGSRYGGIKQIEPVGVNGEIILEYSIFDAIRAGFGKVVFVIRRDIQADFDEHVLPRFSNQHTLRIRFSGHGRYPPTIFRSCGPEESPGVPPMRCWPPVRCWPSPSP